MKHGRDTARCQGVRVVQHRYLVEPLQVLIQASCVKGCKKKTAAGNPNKRRFLGAIQNRLPFLDNISAYLLKIY